MKDEWGIFAMGLTLGILLGILIGLFIGFQMNNYYMKNHVCYEEGAFERVLALQIYCQNNLNNAYEESWKWWNSNIGFQVIEDKIIGDINESSN